MGVTCASRAAGLLGECCDTLYEEWWGMKIADKILAKS